MMGVGRRQEGAMRAGGGAPRLRLPAVSDREVREQVRRRLFRAQQTSFQLLSLEDERELSTPRGAHPAGTPRRQARRIFRRR